MSTDPSKSPALRASDADRDRVIDTLRAAVADGRLDPAEYDERVETALSARTFEALAPLTADLGPGTSVVPAPATPAPKRVVIKQKHGVVLRNGDWVLPRQLVLRTAWSGVELDFTRAVPSGPELILDVRVRGGGVKLILAPGMVVNANELTMRFGGITLPTDAENSTPTTLTIRLRGRLKHGGIEAVYQTPGAEKTSEKSAD